MPNKISHIKLTFLLVEVGSISKQGISVTRLKNEKIFYKIFWYLN